MWALTGIGQRATNRVVGGQRGDCERGRARGLAIPAVRLGAPQQRRQRVAPAVHVRFCKGLA